MIVAHVSVTPLEGAVWAVAAAFREAGHDSFCVAPDAYESGRRMPTDYCVPPTGGAAARLAMADVIVCHGPLPYREAWYPRGKPTVFWLHRLPCCSGNDVPGGWPCGVAGGLSPPPSGQTPLPELVPLGHRFYQPGAKATDRVRVLLAKSPDGGRGSTCFQEELAASIAGRQADVEVVSRLSFADRLARMATAHVVVEETPERSYGPNSIEAMALGCVVVNTCDGLAAWNIQRMTGGCGPPFEVAQRGRLGQTLGRLIDLGPNTLRHMGQRNRDWLTRAWSPGELIDRNIEPLIEVALRNKAGARNMRRVFSGTETETT